MSTAFNGDVSAWNTAAVTTMAYMFADSLQPRHLCLEYGGGDDNVLHASGTPQPSTKTSLRGIRRRETTMSFMCENAAAFNRRRLCLEHGGGDDNVRHVRVRQSLQPRHLCLEHGDR